MSTYCASISISKNISSSWGGQLKITGSVVNVPADVNNTVTMLPRLTGTIKVQLKRRLQYKSSALSLNIRPNKVIQAAAWLVNTSPLYQDEGILLMKIGFKIYKTLRMKLMIVQQSQMTQTVVLIL